jgi:hypothetical protein
MFTLSHFSCIHVILSTLSGHFQHPRCQNKYFLGPLCIWYSVIPWWYLGDTQQIKRNCGFLFLVCGSRYGMGTLGHSGTGVESEDRHSNRLPGADAGKVDWSAADRRWDCRFLIWCSSYPFWLTCNVRYIDPPLSLGVYGTLVVKTHLREQWCKYLMRSIVQTETFPASFLRSPIISIYS